MTMERRSTASFATPTINLASLVCGLDAYLRARGADAGEALRRAGLEACDLSDPDRRVPLIRYLELLEICAELLADPQFGLKFGAQYEPRHAGVVGNVALASRTVGEAFAAIGRYLPTMVDATVHGLEISDGTAFVYSYYVDPLMMSYRQKGDWAIAFMCNLVRRDWAIRAGPRRRCCCRSLRTDAGAAPNPRGHHGRQHPHRPSLGRHPLRRRPARAPDGDGGHDDRNPDAPLRRSPARRAAGATRRDRALAPRDRARAGQGGERHRASGQPPAPRCGPCSGA